MHAGEGFRVPVPITPGVEESCYSSLAGERENEEDEEMHLKACKFSTAEQRATDAAMALVIGIAERQGVALDPDALYREMTVIE